MTPLHLEILLHYYYRIEDHKTVIAHNLGYQYAIVLMKKGYLFRPEASSEGEVVNSFCITDAGKDKVHELLGLL